MSISLYQSIRLLIVQTVIQALWIFEFITYPLRYYKKIGIIFLFFFYILFASFFLYYKEYIRYALNGVMFETSSKENSNLTIGTKIPDKVVTKVNEITIPDVSAQIVLVMDKKLDKVLYEKNSNTHFASASTTKLMTALTTLEIYDLDSYLIIPKDCTEVEGTKVGFPEGEEFKVRDLLYGLLVYSAADSACVLSDTKVPYYDFVWLMNKNASRIGMKDTYFTNPIGLDSVDNSHYSTAADLYKLSVSAMNNSLLKNIVKTKEYEIVSRSEDFKIIIENTNKLLWEIPQTVGIKTGTTEAAGEVLIYEYMDDSKDVVVIVMGSEDRFSDTTSLLNWVLDSYSWD